MMHCGDAIESAMVNRPPIMGGTITSTKTRVMASSLANAGEIDQPLERIIEAAAAAHVPFLHQFLREIIEETRRPLNHIAAVGFRVEHRITHVELILGSRDRHIEQAALLLERGLILGF